MTTKITYRPEIDGLRTIAVMSVVLFHAEFVFIDRNPIPGGYLGVDVFFVISGYLISSIILNGLAENSFSYLEFYERRARRILPILFTVILASMPFAWLYILPQQLIDYADSILYSILFSSNFLFWLEDSYWAAESGLKPFLHTWSLAVEEQFYFIMPLLLIVLYRYLRSAIMPLLIFILLCSLAFAEWASSEIPEFSFFLLPARMWELLAGTVLAVLEIRRGRHGPQWMSTVFPPFGVLLICLPFFFFDLNTKHPSSLTLLPVVGTMLVIWFCKKGEIVTDVLSTRVFVGIGLLSYGLYIWHFPVFAFAERIFSNLTNGHKLALLAATFAVTTVTYLTIERPFRSKSMVSTRGLLASLGVVSVISLSAASIATIDGFKHRFPDFVNQQSVPETFSRHLWFKSSGGSQGQMILVGDSHMKAISHQLREVALASGYDFATSIFPGCQLIMGLNRVNKDTFEINKKCTIELNEERLNFIESAQPAIVVIGGRFPLFLEEESFNNQEGGARGNLFDILQNASNSLSTQESRREAIFKNFKKTIERIINAGHSVMLIYPIPEVGWHVPKSLLRIIDGDYINAAQMVTRNPITTSFEVFQNRARSSYQLLDSIDHPGILRIYPEKLFCNTQMEGRCITHDSNRTFYRDSHHLSDTGAEILAGVIMDTIQSSVQ